MNKAFLGLSVVGCIAYGVVTAASASASPVSLIRGVSNAEVIGVQTVDYRRCWWSDGRRVCRYVYGYGDDDWHYRHHRDWRWRWRHHHWY